MPLTHFIVIRRDLTFGEYSAQLAHAGEAYYQRARFEDDEEMNDARRNGDAILPPHLHSGLPPSPPIVRMEFNDTTCIVKGARNEIRLLRLEAVLLDAKVPHIAIREETGEKGGRLAGQLTCLSLMPTEREKVEHLLGDFHNIEALDGPKPSPT